MSKSKKKRPAATDVNCNEHIEYAEIKKMLLEMARRGEPRPAGLLGEMLDKFTKEDDNE